MWSSAASFGAPVTEPGGNVAASRSAQVRPSASRPSTVLTRWTSPGCTSVASSSGTVMEP